MLDEKGRVTTREGIKQITNNISTSDTLNTLIVKSLGDYTDAAGNSTIVAGAGANIYTINTATTPYTLVQQTIQGSPTAKTDGNWQFRNFNNKFYGAQKNNKPITYDGLEWLDLEDVTGFTPPTGLGTFTPNCFLGDFGRLWAADVAETRDVVYYSDLLIGHSFAPPATPGGPGGGFLDLKKVWSGDIITALASFMGKLIVFGKNNIVIFQGPWDVNFAGGGSTFQLEEVIEGVGCIARDSVQLIGDDIVFLSSSGVRSLGRTIQQDTMPLTDLSLAIKDEIRNNILTTDMTTVKAQYDLSTGSYILGFPSKNVVYVFDFKATTPDGVPRITTWNFALKRSPRSYLSTDSYLYCGLGANNYDGRVAIYDGYYDVEKVLAPQDGESACLLAGNSWNSVTNECFADVDNSYQSDFKTTWLDFEQPGISKFLKRFLAIWSGGKNTDVTLNWFRDYSVLPDSASFTLDPVSDGEPFLYGKILGGYPSIPQANSTLYGVTTVTTTTAGAFIVTSPASVHYAIASLGNTTQAQWNTTANTTGVTYGVGSVFIAHNVGNGTGTAVSHIHSGTPHSKTAKYAPSFSPAEYKVSMSRAAKVVRLEIIQTVKGYKSSLQNITILAKQGKIR